MKRYDSYKGSGVEWIGEIPSHWKLKKIKHHLLEKPINFQDLGLTKIQFGYHVRCRSGSDIPIGFALTHRTDMSNVFTNLFDSC